MIFLLGASDVSHLPRKILKFKEKRGAVFIKKTV